MLRLLCTEFDHIYSLSAVDHGAARQYIHRHLIDALNREAKRCSCGIDDLASTLLFAAHKGGRFVAGHIGDGVIAQVDVSGKPRTLSHPENGEYANTTVFVTDPSAERKFRIYQGDADADLAGFVVMSDGCAESLYDKRTGNPAAAISKLLAWNEKLSRAKTDAILAMNLEKAFSQKSADDCSLGLMSIVKTDGDKVLL